MGAEINPIMYTKKEWEASRITPFYHNVIEDAIALWVWTTKRELSTIVEPAHELVKVIAELIQR